MSKGNRNRAKRAAAAQAARPQPGTPALAVPGSSVRIRHAADVEELAQFERWASMADAGGPVTARRLIEAHNQGFLATSLDFRTCGAADERAYRAGQLEAMNWAHTFALVAVDDSGPIGGLLAGPSEYFLSRMPPQAGPEPIMKGILRTSKLHFVSVDDAHRRSGAGSALVAAALSIVKGSQADVFYGQYEADDHGLERFYRKAGFTVHPTGTGLDFSSIFGFNYGPAPMPTERFFTKKFY
ncbi:GNAT family N-acetyltransferase [Nocardia tengchongensis]|uniref:GNAT family N-acetyltransferase n=1 Tax=Nocardia tengchongensis TaxID=2055889 RepID=UPI00361F7E3B